MALDGTVVYVAVGRFMFLGEDWGQKAHWVTAITLV
jgi:hypothetical protein